MLIIPSIDIRGGRCVRLRRGRFDSETVYELNPFAQLEAFARAGATWIHVVDLDGAQSGGPVQSDLVRDLVRNIPVKLQVGGGIRTRDHVQRLLDAGIARVVVGSMAVRRPDTVRDWLEEFGAERLCCAFDLNVTMGLASEIAADGWKNSTGISIDTVFQVYPPGSLTHVLVTDIARDGVLTGSNTPLISQVVARRPDLRIQSSGGVAALEDLAALRKAGAAAAIVGRAFYEGHMRLEDALAS